ncbi:MAG TPA: FAD:protein FMN transferase [Nocardioides sp.]|uniref:FAD:protein FMN transferase n=1 Tax=Nocardioides sp. TaxID=35761 RepID=UPI002E377806|nr:FAD:protein FMN transferase [Nocardioides sp.]HEX5087106.1 FAD:protein FMN transferase [Nocardioides sp.]
MSALQWRDWSCTVRVVLADGLAASEPPQSRAAARVEALLRCLMDDVARSASRFRSDSDLSRVNLAAGRLVPVRTLTLELVEVALAAARDTDGACDPTIGRHLLAAGYDADIDVVRTRRAHPTDREWPTGIRPAADWTAVRVDRELGRIGVPAGLALDLGATAKAWTADEAAARLARALGVPALVALGGDVAASGSGPEWPLLVSEHEGGSGEVIGLVGGGIATSSTRGRRWATSTGEAHHLIDPRTGAPVDGPYRCATVLADTCADANALSTAALVWGDEALERLAPHAARLVERSGRVVTTAGWPGEDVAA